MQRYGFILILFVCINVFAQDIQGENITPQTINADNTARIDKCVKDYTDKQMNSYSRKTQENLFNLLSKLTNGLSSGNMTYDEKIVILAKRQCELYNKMGLLK
jgi:hypothetical protein